MATALFEEIDMGHRVAAVLAVFVLSEKNSLATIHKNDLSTQLLPGRPVEMSHF
jgi:hypothetical protein